MDRENAWAMIQGYEKDNKRCYSSIFTVSEMSWSLKDGFSYAISRHIPKLISYNRRYRSTVV